jgi:hypothetical protein
MIHAWIDSVCRSAAIRGRWSRAQFLLRPHLLTRV